MQELINAIRNKVNEFDLGQDAAEVLEEIRRELNSAEADLEFAS